MATVTGLTAARMLVIEAMSIVTGAVSGDNLILTRRDGTDINAGNVRGPKGDKGEQGASGGLTAYPVGAIFMSTIATNPATQLGGGTWEAWGTGRVPVAVDTSQTDFDTAEKTGGEKNHTLTEAELPSHDHANDHNHPAFNTSNSGVHLHSHPSEHSEQTGIRNQSYTDGASPYEVIAPDGAHSHPIEIPPYSGRSGNAGSDSPHNNMPPYITCYMWKRTA